MFYRFFPRVFALLMLVSSGQIVAAQDVVPPNRFIFSQDSDFPGNDLATLLDTDRSACEQACRTNSNCAAFTFNTRNGACFPKSSASEPLAFAGALSARKIPTDPVVLANQEARQSVLTSLGQSDFDAARTLAAKNARSYPVTDRPTEDLAALLSAALGRADHTSARAWAGSLAAATDSQAAWTAYSFAALRLPESLPANQRRAALNEAVPAAINGVFRAIGDPAEAAALDQLAQALERNGRGRDSIIVLRRAVALSGREDLNERLDKAIGTYGFRVTDHQVDTDSAQPRICVTFSEKLPARGVAFDNYVKVVDTPVITEAQDGQLCLDGVRHGEKYSVTLRRGLPAASGEILQKDVTLEIYVRDRSPSVRFPGRAYVLPRAPGAALPMETVNLDSVDLQLRAVSDRNLLRAIKDGYFGRPLSKYEDDAFAADIAAEIWTGTAQVRSELNIDTTTRLPLDEMLEGRAPGIYALTARIPGADPWDDPGATQWFVLSDLGLGTQQGTNGLHVSVRALATAKAVTGATVSLISKTNSVLAKADTDDDGFAVFAPGLTRGQGARSPALVLVETADDLAFLSLTGPAFDLSDRGVEGRPATGPLDVFVATDRGAYRAGETIGVTALVRNQKANAVAGLPLTAILRRPDGAEYSRSLAANPAAGGHVFELPIGTDVPRGTWRLDLVLGDTSEPLASQTLLVEDFLPERLDFDVTLPDVLRSGDTVPVVLDAQYLFGAPASGLQVEAEVRLSPTRTLEDWPGFVFGPHDSPVRPVTAYLDGTRTGSDGKVNLLVPVPETGPEPLAFSAEIVARVSEGSGRPVERQSSAPVTTGTSLVGIRPDFEGPAHQGGEALLSLVALDGSGKVTDEPLTWSLNKVVTRYQWYQLNGRWTWEPITRRTRIATGEVALKGAPVTVSAPVEWGQYELVAELQDGSFAYASHLFSAGWYGAGDARDTPDRLSVGLDRSEYTVGQTAQLLVDADAAGTGLVSVLSSDIVHREVVGITKGENRIPLTVDESWGSGAYVTVSLLRPSGDDDPAPKRAMGLAHAKVSPGLRQLDVSLTAPEISDGQAGTISVDVEVDGASSATWVTLAAVDIGILNLTGQPVPDPSRHYFGQRRLGVEMRDLYGRLIDGQSGPLGQVRSGGDAGAAMTPQAPPPTEAPMVFFSGLVPLDGDGRARIDVPKPAFNGTIRLDAVAWSAEAVGNASQEIIARDPVVMTASLPRFLAPGDSSRLLLEFVSVNGATPPLPLRITAPGIQLGNIPLAVIPGEDGTARVEVPLAALETGDHRLTATLTLPDGATVQKELTLGVRLNDPEVSETRRFTLGAGQTFRFDTEVFAGFRPGQGSATVTAGPLARLDMPGLIEQLDRTPYGCTEQLTSGALPLLYLSEFSPHSDTKAKIKTAISRIMTRQTASGAFGLWRAETGYFWLDAYVTDFLTQARDAGFDVPEQALELALSNLNNRINYAPDFENGGEDIAYALLVLAREGRASMADLRYFADAKRGSFSTPLSIAQLGAALASYGDSLRADQMFTFAVEKLNRHTGTNREWRNDFGSPVSDRAGILRLAAAANSNAVVAADLARNLDRTRSLSTQEAAQVLLAMNTLRKSAGSAGISVNDVPAAGPVVQRLANRPGGSVFNIKNTGDAPTDITLSTFGIPEVAPEAGGYGYALTREWFNPDGTPHSGPVTPGQQLVVVLTVTPFEETGARLMIEDPLPAGLEIDNPRLIQSGQIRELEWLKTAQTQSAEFLADRFRAAVDVRGINPVRVAYKVRAVTPGNYHHPAALVHDMYRPEYRAVTATGRLQVLP